MKKKVHVKEYTRKKHGRAKFGGKVSSHDKSGRTSTEAGKAWDRKHGRAKTSKKAMMAKTKIYLDKMASRLEVVDPAIVRDEDGDHTFQVATDGDMYDYLFNPDNVAALIHDTNVEFGISSKQVNPIDVGYREQNKFRDFLTKQGWNFELYGGGILTIYPEG